MIRFVFASALLVASTSVAAGQWYFIADENSPELCLPLSPELDRPEAIIASMQRHHGPENVVLGNKFESPKGVFFELHGMTKEGEYYWAFASSLITCHEKRFSAYNGHHSAKFARDTRRRQQLPLSQRK